ncbi:MAG: hypothetical protein SangKO_039570 [Sandaracinaceae bacterium]
MLARVNHPSGGGFGPPGGPPQPPSGGGGFGQPPSGGGGGFGQPPGGFGPPPGGQPPMGQGGGGFGPPPGPQGVHIQEGPAIIMAIVSILLCGCLPGGLVGLLLANQAKQAAARGDESGARSKLMMSYAASGISMALMMIVIFLYFVLMVLGAVA